MKKVLSMLLVGLIVTFLVIVTTTNASACGAEEPMIDTLVYPGIDGLMRIDYHLYYDKWATKIEVKVDHSVVTTVIPETVQKVTTGPVVPLGAYMYKEFSGVLKVKQKGSYIIGFQFYNETGATWYKEIRRVADNMNFELANAQYDSVTDSVSLLWWGYPLFGHIPVTGENPMKVQLGNYEYNTTINCQAECYVELSISAEYYRTWIQNHIIDTYFDFDHTYRKHTEISYPDLGL